MDNQRKTIRNELRKALATDFHNIIKEAKFTDTLTKIAVLKFKKGKCNYQIADYLKVSCSTVDKAIRQIYDIVAEVLKRRKQ